MKPAFVYVAAIHGRSDICKIGYSKNPEERAKKLKSQYGLDSDCYIFMKSHCDYAWRTEQTIHKILSSKRIEGEFFSVSPKRAARIVEIVAGRFFHVPTKSYYEVINRDFELSFVIPPNKTDAAFPHAKRFFRKNNVWNYGDANMSDYRKCIMEAVL